MFNTSLPPDVALTKVLLFPYQSFTFLTKVLLSFTLFLLNHFKKPIQDNAES